jgi:hypothetical protein
MNDDPEVMRNRAANAARLAAEALPPEIELKLRRFWRWNGSSPPPQITHRTRRGVFIIRAQTPRKTTEVFFDQKSLGSADSDPRSVARQLFNGAFDSDLGFRACDFVPSSLAAWDDLGG